MADARIRGARRRFVHAGASALLAVCGGLYGSLYGGLPAAHAQGSNDPQNYPGHPIRILVPYAAGGGVDLVARVVSKGLTEVLGQGVVVENKPGGATNIAAEQVARSAPDGYTLFAASRANAINPSLYKKLPFDIEKDFVPITVAAEIPNILVVSPDVPVKSVADLIALAKAEPGKLTFASAGLAGSTHLAGELFKTMTGTNILHVPYRGGGPASVDLMSGRVTMYFATMPSVLGYIRAGKLRALAVTSLKRSQIAPEYPTLDEEGLKGYRETSWIGLMAPAGTPPAVIEKLNKAVVQVLQKPEYRKLLLDQGAEIVANSQQEFAAFLKQDIANTKKIIDTAHITLE
jgi:tripartite-type tricarboxylate transporter receptor subunit TctC